MKARVFINDKDDWFQIFSFSQERDGSIYASFPNFNHAKWILVSQAADGLIATKFETPETSKKLSMHASGLVGFHGGPGTPYPGNKLVVDETTFGIRHLFTAQMQAPFYKPESAVNVRKNDYAIKTSELRPAVFMFFAIPKTNFSLEFSLQFPPDSYPLDIHGNPQKFEASGIIELDKHVILWIAYITKYMNWATNPHIFYADGYKIPFIVGNGNDSYQYLLINPIFEMKDGTISIKIKTSDESI